jgi:hypothetical protein
MHRLLTTWNLLSSILLSLAPLSLFAENVTVFKELNKANWQIVHKSSEETKAKSQSAKNAIDGNPNTIWHTEWKDRSPSHPHEIIIDMGRIQNVNFVTHLPRQDGSSHGRILEYQIYLGMNLDSMALVATGSFPEEETQNTIEINPTKARYLRFVALSELDGNPWTSIAEIGVMYETITDFQPSKLTQGKVSLSSGKAIHDIPVRVHFQSGKEDYFVNVKIDEGSSSANFQIPIPDSKSGILYYEISDPLFAIAGFQSSRGTSHLRSNAIEWKPGNSSDLVLVKLIHITGILTLPDGQVAEKDLSMYVDAYDSHFGPLHFSDSPIFKKGQSSAPFHIEIPEGILKRFKLKLINYSGGYLRGSLYTRKGVIPYYEISENAYLDPKKDRLTNIIFTIIPDDTVLSEKEMIKKGAELGSQISKEILKPEYTEFEKLLRVHDYLVENYEYFSEDLVPKYKLLAPNDTHHTRIPFLNKLAVCGGFADMSAFLLNEAGMKAGILNAHPIFDHGWTTVSIRGKSYHVDITGDEHDGTYQQLLMSDSQKVRIGMEDKVQSPDYYWDLKGSGLRDRSFIFQKSDYIHKDSFRSPEFLRVFGNIHLPESEIASASGLGLLINSETECYIPPGEKSCFFALKILRNNPKPFIHIMPQGSYFGGYYSALGLKDTPENAEKIKSPNHLIPEDEFSARWTRNLNLTEGYYEFSASADDGIRVFIDDRILIDEWRPQAYASFSKKLQIKGGSHKFRIEYFE